MRLQQCMLMLSLCGLLACNNEAKQETAAAPSTSAEAVTPPDAVIGDSKFIQTGKDGLAAMSAGDVDKWSASWADNIVWRWNNGDSVVGKPAVIAYWKERRTKLIDSIEFTSQIWLPLTVNKPQATEATGDWLLSWYATNAKYKNGKRMMQRIHTAQHFNANGQIDQVIQYLDREPINRAMK